MTMRRPRTITFLVEDAPNNGYVARAVGHAVFTDADRWEALPTRIRDAVRCHFGAAPRTAIVRYSGRNGSQTLVLPLDTK